MYVKNIETQVGNKSFLIRKLLSRMEKKDTSSSLGAVQMLRLFFFFLFFWLASHSYKHIYYFLFVHNLLRIIFLIYW